MHGNVPQESPDNIMAVDNGFLAIGLALAWIKLFKLIRVTKWGPFVVIVGEMLEDSFQFVVLWGMLLIAYGVAFTVIFQGQTDDYRYVLYSMV
jgi:hypothetical protein